MFAKWIVDQKYCSIHYMASLTQARSKREVANRLMESRKNALYEINGKNVSSPFFDDQLRITFKGEANREQREQVDLAAKLISKILSGSG